MTVQRVVTRKNLLNLVSYVMRIERPVVMRATQLAQAAATMKLRLFWGNVYALMDSLMQEPTP